MLAVLCGTSRTTPLLIVTFPVCLSPMLPDGFCSMGALLLYCQVPEWQAAACSVVL